ncbi:MAG: DUF484 family protein, partial [Lysobacteraceae bacterium]
MTMNPMNPITEDDIANYLVHTPDFFERHAQLLSSVQMTSPHGNRAVSLQERQAEMLRDKIKALEHRVMDMIRNGNENLIIADKLHRWTRALLLAREARHLPEIVVQQFREQFLVPQASIKVWGVSTPYAGEAFAQGASEDAKSFASSLTTPYCGLNSGFEPASWLEDPQAAISLALVPLRAAGSPQAFGLIVLASPDPQRFNTEMGTDFLERIS